MLRSLLASRGAREGTQRHCGYVGWSEARNIGADALLLIKVLALFLAFGVLTVVLLAGLDAAAEMVRLRLQTRRELRRRFGKRLRSRPHLEEDTQELTLDDTQELTPVQRPRRGRW